MPKIRNPLLLSTDSALRHLPVGISRKQALFLDGIRFTAQTAVLAYDRLARSLTEIGLQRRQDPGAIDEHLVVTAIADAWLIVDVVHRLRSMLQQMPGWKTKAAGARLFERRTQDVETLRHFMQHINNEVGRLLVSGVPLLGFIQWVALVAPDGKACAYMLVPGTVGTFEQDIVIKKKEPLRGPVGQIRLVATNTVLWLEPIIDEVRDLAIFIEQGLLQYDQDGLTRQADLVVEIDLDDLKFAL